LWPFFFGFSGRIYEVVRLDPAPSAGGAVARVTASDAALVKPYTPAVLVETTIHAAK